MHDGWLETPFDLSGRRVWVAGHRGMVGGATVRRLAWEGCEVLTVTREELDLRRQGDVERWMATHKPDVVILAAAKVGGIGANMAAPAEFLYDNMMIEGNVIHGAHKAGVEKLLFLGSSCIYPKEAALPIAEGALLSGALEPTNEAYAVAKIAGLKLCQAYRAQYGADFIAAMPCNLYGEGDRYDEAGSHVIPALISKAHAAKVAGADEMVVWGSGQPLREFLYVDDLADGLVFLLKGYAGAQHVNIGSGDEFSIGDVAAMVCEVVGFEGGLVFDEGKPDGTLRKVMDSGRIKGAGWMPSVSFKEGLGRAYKDYLKLL
jgi:GDP-L-fucose synthase